MNIDEGRLPGGGLLCFHYERKENSSTDFFFYVDKLVSGDQSCGQKRCLYFSSCTKDLEMYSAPLNGLQSVPCICTLVMGWKEELHNNSRSLIVRESQDG